MPIALVHGELSELAKELARLGLNIDPSPSARTHLARYIVSERPRIKLHCTDRSGWHGKAFVLPTETISDGGTIFQSETGQPAPVAARGTLESWRAAVAAPCIGNSRMAFAVSAALAAPLLHWTGTESGGFHLRGSSSTGKSTAQRIAASVWGGPDFKRTWHATGNSLEAVAGAHNGLLLILDELEQVDAKDAGAVAYMLANGEGKGRAYRTGTGRNVQRWQLLFLSSGEIGLAEHMRQAGKTIRAGQEARLADIPADAGKGHGAFETLHTRPNGESIANHLTAAAAEHYGTAGPAFVRGILPMLDKLPAEIKKARTEFLEECGANDAGGQAQRVAGRFALVAIAGELASALGVTGWPIGTAKAACMTCFNAWLEARGGKGNQEARAMLAQVRGFLEAHGSSRYTRLDDRSDDARTINRAGFTDGDGSNGGLMFYTLPEAFKREVCEGFDSTAVAKMLLERGMLVSNKLGRATYNKRLPGMGLVNCYAIDGGKLWAT